MTPRFRFYIQFTLALLIASLAFGMLSSFAFIYPESFNKFLPFYQLRPFHVSAALFWIITGATTGIMYYRNGSTTGIKAKNFRESIFMLIWMATILAIFGCYAMKKFGGREYWEFPPVLSFPLLISW